MNKILLYKILPLFTFLLIGNTSFAQAPAIEWQTRVIGRGSNALPIKSTTDGGYVVSGTTNPAYHDVPDNHGSDDFYIIKLNNTGTIQWQKSYGGTSDDVANSIAQTTDGGYIVVGQSHSNNGDATYNHGMYDYWVIKTDSTGTLQWQKSYGGSSSDYAQDVKQTRDGGYVVTGYTRSTNGDVSGTHVQNPAFVNLDYWVIKIDSIGTLQWQKCLGNDGMDSSYSIQQTNDGGYIVAGKSDGNGGDVTGNHGGEDYWVVKLNSEGILEWQKSLGGVYTDWGTCIRQATDGGYVICGFSSIDGGDVTGNHGGTDCWVVKLDYAGTLQWQKSLGGSSQDDGMAIEVTTDGGYIITGSTSSDDGDVTGNHGNVDYWVVKIDSAGNLTWQKALGGSDADLSYSITQSADGGYVVAGMSFSTDGDVIGSPENGYVWIVKLASDTAGLNAPTKNSLTLYPNPGNGTFTLNTEKLFTGTATLNVYSAFGQLLYSKQITEATTTTISLPEFATGIYNVQLLANNKSHNQKLIIE